MFTARFVRMDRYCLSLKNGDLRVDKLSESGIRYRANVNQYRNDDLSRLDLRRK